MIKTVFSSDCLPAAERLARFDELQVNSEHPAAAVRLFGCAPLDTM